MSKEIIGKRFPLSLSQINILNLERTLRGTSVNNISTTIRISGRVDFHVLGQSIQLVLESDPSLRTRLTEENGEIVQYHAPYTKENFSVYDFTNTSREGIENWERAVTHELIPIMDGPLYRFVLFRDGETSGGILVKLHHIIADGWSQILLCNKIGKTYLELLAGKTPELPEAPSYELHVMEEQEYLASKAYTKDERYWKEILTHSEEPSLIKDANGAAISPVGCRKSFDLPGILNHAIYSFCLKNRVAPFAVFYMALAIYFKRQGGANSFTIGVPIFNRTNYQFKQSTGMFVTTLPFVNEIDDSWSLNEFNNVLAERWLELLRHQRYPFSRISTLSGKDSRLFNIALSYQDSKIYESRDASVLLSGRWHYSGYQAEHLTIHLTNLKNNSEYAVDYDYLTQLFTEEEITALHNNLCHILFEALQDPDRPIHKLNILSMEQKEELIYRFNRTDRYLEPRLVSEALIAGNVRHLNRAAIIHRGERTSYGTLFQRSSQFVAALESLNLPPETPVAIYLPRGAELAAAMLGVLEAGCAFVLLSETLPKERIKVILEQSGAAAIITSDTRKRRLPKSDIPVIFTEDAIFALYLGNSSFRKNEEKREERLAYVVYTSGSTGEPKGVEITHKNLLNLAQEMKTVYGQGAVLSLCNIGFDAFMLESIVALLNGRTIVMPEESELESPERLAALMNEYAVGFFSLTPSRLSAFLQNRTFRNVMWRMESIVCGGEHFPPELLKKLKLCTNARIYNQYGPSEATVAVSMKEISQADTITAGSPMGNCRLYVLDQWMNPLPIGGNGRLFVGGLCVGRGYRNRPELTEKAFRPNPFVIDDRIYDTGDLAHWTADGEIVLMGRADRQVKLHGLRIELQEVSACIESYPGVAAAYARICNVGGQDVLGAYFVSDEPIEETELLAHAATHLPLYMIPVFLMRVDCLETTVNGKLDESKLPLPDINGHSANVTVTETARIITEIFRDVLDNNDISAASDYYLSGGNSLNALETILQIEEELGKKIRVADLYACRTPARLAEMIDGGAPEKREDIHALKKAPANSVYPLTNIQQGIYIQSLLDENGINYNMPGAFLLEKAVDTVRLESAFRALIQQEPVFRTVFVRDEKGVSAKILETAEFALEELTADSYGEACDKFVRPFSLDKAPLIRGAVWHAPNGKCYLFMDSHHIIGDGMSTPLVLQRLDKLYCGEKPAVEWNFYDYVYTLGTRGDSDQKRDLEYWKEHLKDIPETLLLPTDKARPAKFDFKGKDISVALSDAQSRRIEEFCRKNGYSEYNLFLAAWGLLLSAVSGKDDFVIGAPVAGRSFAGSNAVCGPFINTMPMRLKPGRELTASAWLEQVRSEITGMVDHASVGLENIISALDLSRDEQNSLYRIMMTQSPVDEGGFMLDGGKLEFCQINTGSVKMELTFELAKQGEKYLLRFAYATSLFEEETVRFYSRCLICAAEELIRHGEKALSELSLLAPADREKYFEAPNFLTTPFINRPLHRMLKSRALQTPDETAVICKGVSTSYGELERRACAIANFLEEKGIEAGQCVALCLRRSADMVAAMYGVLKAGCAYTFLLESFPATRLLNMLELSKAAIILCDGELKALENTDIPCEICALPDGEADDYADRPVTDDSLVNVLFTSGSTGEPKGVMLRHRSFANLCAQFKVLFEDASVVLCSTNTVFDCFIVENIIPLALGKTVVMADEEEMLLPWKLAELIENHNVQILQMTPSRLQMCLGNGAFCNAAKHLRVALLGGEVLTEALRDKFYLHSSGKLMNMYGPTESTILTAMGLAEKDKHITIGRPMQNVRAYVLDEDGRQVLPTACGELYIAGECLAAGYASRPEMTEEFFVDDPFFPGEKMYRSGDLVRLRADGCFDYVGRKDHQVKLNGQRVELSEITSAMEKSGLTAQSAVVPLRREDGSMELCAFYVAGENKCSQNELISCLEEKLPPYMMPSRFVKLDEMPMTATAKTDVKALRKLAEEGVFEEELPAEPETVSEIAAEPQSDAVETEPQQMSEPEAEPIKETVCEKAAPEAKPTVQVPDLDYIVSVWKNVLGKDKIDPDISFFKQGGTSMSALSVMTRYYNDGYELALSDFYKAPTPNGQAELFREKYPEKYAAAEKEQHKAILVTGVTGFLGIHILRELILKGEKHIFCIARGNARERLEAEYSTYFNDTLPEEVTVLSGNVTLDRLGLSEEEYGNLVSSVGEIYHCAADVRHYAENEDNHLKVNVDGTERALILARAAGAAFYHMSTCSLSGDRLKKNSEGEAVFTEDDFDIGQNWEDNIYVKSKYLGEERVREAAKEGLKVKIFRLGRLVGRMTDGKYQLENKGNTFYLLVNGLLQMGAVPAEAATTPIDLTPIDLCTKEIVTLKDGEDMVYHIICDAPPTLYRVMFALDHDVQIVSGEEFSSLLKEKLEEGSSEELAVVMNQWLSFKTSKPKIMASGKKTVEALRQLGFELPKFSIETVLKEFGKERNI
ncbi:MAG: amino acid adenylation domain-containing protein [Oscillospiraceae bacterium]|nr:amino acid adenylation domain-containing protein [Oscillospiraceae bacterium]